MFRETLRRLLRSAKGPASCDVAAEPDERLAFQILADVVPRALRGLLLRPRLGSCRSTVVAGVPARVIAERGD